MRRFVSMNRPRLWSALILAATLIPGVRAADPPASPWGLDRALTVSPSPAPSPALKYLLLPLSSELKEGNAVPIYLRLVYEQSDAARKFRTETPKKWNAMPLDKVPLDEAHAFMKQMWNFYGQLELGARRTRADWNYTLDAGDPIGILLPDVQTMRSYAPPMILQARVALAERDYAAAAHHLQTGFAFSRHVAGGLFFIQGLVGIALAGQFADTVDEFIERPDSPNLCWALTALPRPLIDLRHQVEVEYRMLEMQFPELGDLDRPRTAEQWDGVLRRFRTEARRVSGLAEPKGPFFPKDTAPGDPASKSPDLPAARAYIARTKGLTAENVEAMPPAQVLLLYFVGTYHDFRDDLFRGAYLPFPEALRWYAAANRRLAAAPPSEAKTMAQMLLPALDRVAQSQARLDRRLDMLRVVEALRVYAAAHDGKLPDKLDEITEAPVPRDPGTGKAFSYSRDGDTATLLSESPDDSLPRNSLRYRVTMRKK
jgi:hypothetical protein